MEACWISLASPFFASAKIALVVTLDREGARLPKIGLYHPPAVLKPTALPPQVALDARFASTPAKIRTALEAFSRDLFRDGFNLN